MTKATGTVDKKDLRIVIAGTGGQGVLTAARFLAGFFLRQGGEVVSGQLHGMAQRGGAVQATVMVNCGPSPAMKRGSADVVVGFEPVETARALEYASAKTAVFMNRAPVIPYILSQNRVLGEGMTEYPAVEALAEAVRRAARRLYLLDATALAREAGSARAMNMVMLGALLGAPVLPYAPEAFMEDVARTSPAKFLEINRKAFALGAAAVRRTGAFEERV